MKLLHSLDRLDRYRDVGLLVLRVGIGLAMIGHGYPKLVGGPVAWAKLGSAMQLFGIDFAPAFWGGAAAVSEAIGGLLLVVGLGTRFAAAALTITLLVAGLNHAADGDGFSGWSHAFETGVACFTLFLVGGGKYALERKF